MGDEVFKGKGVMTNTSSTIGNSFGSATGFSSTGTATAVGSVTTVGTTYSGNVKAVLLSNQGNSMTCFFNYADPTGFTPMGGVGECQTSDGRIVDVVW